MKPTRPVVHLRPVEQVDLPALFDFQCDLAANRMAAVRPRDNERFDAHWQRALGNPSVTARAILADGVLVGTISRFVVDQQHAVGYWIDRAHWSRGIATQALALLLREVATRPLHARVAEHNAASIRVLQRCGFRVTGHEHSPADDRLLECREVLLTLA